MIVDRKTFLGLVRESANLTAWSARPTSDCSEDIKMTMPKSGHARLVAGLGGGDEQLTYAMWEYPTRERPRQLTLVSRRTRLWELEERSQVVTVPEQGRIF